MDNVVTNDGIAIIGMACRFPGAANLQGYWDICWNGIDAITEVPSERWDINAIFDTDQFAMGKTYSRCGGFLEHLDRFDASFFNISPREARHIDPRQRLMLETSWEALEDSGIVPLSLAGSNTGVYIAALVDEYGKFVFSDPKRVDAYSGSGVANSILANRLSYFYDFHGASLTLDTACSGSLVAIHMAAQSLRSKEHDLALVGGVNIILSPDSMLFFSRAGALSRSGRCRAFDRDADGFVRAEGAGMVVLKRFTDAVADNNRIYAVICGSAVNQDGRTSGIMAPNCLAQELVIKRAYCNAKISPSYVQYFEAHGTGTPLGDQIEAQALGRVLSDYPSDVERLIGSVKTNIGHTEAAAGMASIIKTAMSIYKKKLPGSLHYTQPNPLIPFKDLPFRVASNSGEWPDYKRQLIAGVSGFGFGGTNAHIVLAAVPDTKLGIPTAIAPLNKVSQLPSLHPPVLFLSAHSKSALQELALSYKQLLIKKECSMSELAYSAYVTRSNLKHRLAIKMHTYEQVINDLHLFANQSTKISAEIFMNVGHVESSKLVFVYPGQGSHWIKMGSALRCYPTFDNALIACDKLAKHYAGLSIIDAINDSCDTAQLDRTDIAQMAIFSIQVALTELLKSLKIIPDIVVGQSLGEVAAAYSAGALSLEDSFFVVYARGTQMKKLQGHGLTAQINLPLNEVQEILKNWGNEAGIAGSNSKGSTVISGTVTAVRDIVAKMEEREIFAQVLKGVDVALHSLQMDCLVPLLTKELWNISPKNTNIKFLSSTDSAYLQGCDLTAEYWGRNLRNPFYFFDTVNRLTVDQSIVFIELSPHDLLFRSLSELTKNSVMAYPVISTLRRNVDSTDLVSNMYAKLFVNGYIPEWISEKPNIRFGLPTYPWQREYYWMQMVSNLEQCSDTAQVQLNTPIVSTNRSDYDGLSNTTGECADHCNANLPAEEKLSQILAMNPANKMKELNVYVTDIIMSVMHIPLSEAEQHRSLISLGLDSIMALELKNKLASHIQVQISIADILQGISLSEIVSKCIEQFDNLSAQLMGQLTDSVDEDLLLSAIEELELDNHSSEKLRG